MALKQRRDQLSDCEAAPKDGAAEKNSVARSPESAVVSSSTAAFSTTTTSTTTWLTSILLILFGVILALVLVEVGFRLLRAAFPPIGFSSDRPKAYFLPAGAPNSRDYPYGYEKPPGVFRIAVVGDSFTFGTAMHLDDNFSKRLERILNLPRPAVPELGPIRSNRVEVLNYGTPGFATWQEVSVLEQLIPREPDLVILQVTLNDAELKPFRVSHPDWLKRPEWPVFRWWHSLEFIVGRVWNSWTYEMHARYHRELFENPENWRRFDDAVRDFKRMTENRGIRFGAVVFPHFSHPFDDNYPFRTVHQKITGRLQELKIPTLDLLEAYKGMDNSRLQILPGRDAHPNEIAHRIAAERIYNWLSRYHLIPRELKVLKSDHRAGDSTTLMRTGDQPDKDPMLY